MAEIVPQSDRVSSTSKTRQLARGAVRTTSRTEVSIADPLQVRNVIAAMERGRTIAAACNEVKVNQQAFWRRLLNDSALKREFAATMIGSAVDLAKAGAGGNAGVLAIFAKLSKEMAASLAPADWGEKVQVESKSLTIVCNLDFAVADSFDGIVVNSEPDGGMGQEGEAVPMPVPATLPVERYGHRDNVAHPTRPRPKDGDRAQPAPPDPEPPTLDSDT